MMQTFLPFCALLCLLWLQPVHADGGQGASVSPAPAGYLARLARFRSNADFRFRDRILSPLTDADRETFSGLVYFEPVPDLALPARFEAAADRSVFAMPTYDRRTLRYSHQGTVFAELDGQRLRLKAFRREADDGRNNFLLIPFRDLTNGTETYSGGRYIELPLPLPADPVLDFNRAANPLCAYDPSYACPIPPPENHLSLPIRAGEKRYRVSMQSP
jgi:hypothetical protein